MKIKDVMTRNVEVARPEEPIQSVAQRMARGDFGFMPVVDGKRIVGTITDRDLTIRALAGAMSASTPVAEVMTRGATYTREDSDLESVLDKMGDEQIRRLPIVNDKDELVGVVAVGDLAAKVKERYIGETMEDISKPRGTQLS